MARARGPYSAAFPVNFTSNGDTTRDAFKKHMDEITRLYGILTEFDKDIANAEGMTGQLTAHINSANPHPNYKPNISWTDVMNKPGLDSLSGTLAASKVKGALTGATIASGNVTGLEAFVNGKIPASKGDGITEGSVNENGYVKFNNGLLLQWGCINYVSNGTAGMAINYPVAFSSGCYSLTVTPQTKLEAVSAYLAPSAIGSELGLSRSGFRVHVVNFSGLNVAGAKLSYTAIGR